MITTSNFAISGADPRAVSIARGNPRAYRGKRYIRLAPTWAMLKLDETTYRIQFAEILAQLDPQQVFNDLVELAGPDAILLCWEKAGRFCHRRLVAGWLESNLGIQVPELERDEPEDPAIPLRLF